MKRHQASTAWISQRVKDSVKEDPTLSAKKLQKRLEKCYNIKLSYFNVWSRKKYAMDDLYGTWEESFIMLWRFKAALEETAQEALLILIARSMEKMHFSTECLCALKHVLIVFCWMQTMSWC